MPNSLRSYSSPPCPARKPRGSLCVLGGVSSWQLCKVSYSSAIMCLQKEKLVGENLPEICYKCYNK